MSDLCRTCKAPIVWARSPKGAAMPFDAAPSDEHGQWLLREGRALYVAPPKRAEHAGELFATHFVTCPDADTHQQAS